MTTFLSQNSNPRLPRPDRHYDHVEKILAEYYAAERRKRRLARFGIAASVVAIAALLVALILTLISL